MNASPILVRGAALLCLVILAAGGMAHAGAHPVVTLRADHAWMRPAAAGGNDAGYLRIVNRGKSADWLVAASTPSAAAVSIHESRMVGQVMTMRMVKALEVPPGSAVTLAPGGFHLMFEGLKGQVRLGQSVPVLLTFAHAGRLKVRFQVSALGGVSAMPGM
ncbi:MAG TPA: copper chaperone PCu(A)C [Caulobacteraceae bacterium]